MGKRDQATTDVFVEGVRNATANRHFQITTDGFAPYRNAIPNTLVYRFNKPCTDYSAPNASNFFHR
jgi:hypothetical protein